MFYGNRTALLLAKHSVGTPLLILKGPSGLGKSIVAKALARKSLCLGNKEKDCECESCKKLKSGNHPDFFYLSLVSKDKKELEKSIKLSDIAFINHEVRTQPLVSSYKIFLIDDADSMTNEAQTRLLKTIEDNPPYVKFLIVTHGDLLQTIMSRGVFINFSPLDNEEIREFISNCTQDTNLQEILSASVCGSPGRAVKLLEDETYIKFVKSIFDCIISNAPVSVVLSEAGLLKEKDAASLAKQSDLFISSFLMCLGKFFFDLLNVKTGNNSILFMSYLSEFKEIERFPLKRLNDIYLEITNCLDECNTNSLTQERLILLFDKIVRGEQLDATA